MMSTRHPTEQRAAAPDQHAEALEQRHQDRAAGHDQRHAGGKTEDDEGRLDRRGMAGSTDIAAASATPAIAITLSRLMTMSAMATMRTARHKFCAPSTPSPSPSASSVTSLIAT